MSLGLAWLWDGHHGHSGTQLLLSCGSRALLSGILTDNPVTAECPNAGSAGAQLRAPGPPTRGFGLSEPLVLTDSDLEGTGKGGWAHCRG